MGYRINRFIFHSISIVLLFLTSSYINANNHSIHPKIPNSVINKLNQQTWVDIIIQVDTGKNKSTAKVESLSERINRYRSLKSRILKSVPPKYQKIELDYPSLPMFKVRTNQLSIVVALANHPDTSSIFDNRKYWPTLSESLPIVTMQEAISMNITGENTTAVIIDSGIDYTRPEFGSCSSPGIPTTCKVINATELATDDGQLDDTNHGTQVSSVVVNIAPQSKLAVFDVFEPTGQANLSSILSAIDWSIQNQATYNITAINMSLGDNQEYTSPCSSPATNPFVFPVRDARSAGISVIASSGNNGFSNGLALPACTPDVLSVGATYDANLTALNWGICTDGAPMIDQITCFSNSADYLDILAPGALINTAGFNNIGGTSISAPFVTGAISLLRSAYPDQTIDSIDSMVLNSRTTITDPRNSVATSRLDILRALGAINDAFANAVSISQGNGTVSGINIGASKETLEPDHDGEAGGASTWWQYTASETGSITITTDGSDFDTVLAAYSGDSLTNLVPIISDNDSGINNNSSITFLVSAGETIWLAVDGVAGATGEIVLSWQLTPEPLVEEDIPTLPVFFFMLLAFLLMRTGMRASHIDLFS